MANQSYNNYYLLQRVTLLSAQEMWHLMFHGNAVCLIFLVCKFLLSTSERTPSYLAETTRKHPQRLVKCSNN